MDAQPDRDRFRNAVDDHSNEQVSCFGRSSGGDFAVLRLRRCFQRRRRLLTRAAAFEPRDDQEVAETTNADAQSSRSSPSLSIGNGN